MIRGEQTNLRAVERTDARLIRDLLNEPSIATGWGTSGIPVSIHRVASDIEGWIVEEIQSGCPSALIVESLDGDAVGLILVAVSNRPNQSMAALSIAMTTSAQGKGLGSDALAALLDALFDEWGIHRVQVHSEAGNSAAIDFYLSLGFVQEAINKRATFTGGEWSDQLTLGMLSTDPRLFAS